MALLVALLFFPSSSWNSAALLSMGERITQCLCGSPFVEKWKAVKRALETAAQLRDDGDCRFSQGREKEGGEGPEKTCRQGFAVRTELI